MKKETEEKIKTIIGIFAFIGIFSTIAFVYDLFDKDNNVPICEEYVSKIENLEIEIDELKSDLSVEEDKNRELENKVEAWKEEYEILEDAKGCDTSGKSKIPLVDGPASN